MFCNNCGRKIKAGSDICPYCQADNTLPNVHSHFEISEEVRQAKESEIRNLQEADGQQGTVPETETGHRNYSETGSVFNPEEERQRQDKIQREKREKRRKLLMWAALAAVVLIAAAGTFRFFNRDVGEPSHEQIISDIENVAEENEYIDEESITITSQTKGLQPEVMVEVTTGIPGAYEEEKELTVTTNTYTLSYEKSGDGWNLMKGGLKKERIQTNPSVKEKNVIEDVKEALESEGDTKVFTEKNEYDNCEDPYKIRIDPNTIKIDEESYTYTLTYWEYRGCAYYEGAIQAAYSWNQETGKWKLEKPDKEPSVTQYLLDRNRYVYAGGGHQYIFYITEIDDQKIAFKFAVDGEEIISSTKPLGNQVVVGGTYYLDINLGTYGHIYIYPEHTQKKAVYYVNADTKEIMSDKSESETYEQLLEDYDSEESDAGSVSNASTGSEAEEAATGASTESIDTWHDPLPPDDSTYGNNTYGNNQNPNTNGYGYGFGSGTNRPSR